MSDLRSPSNTAFKQQRLPAWQPVITPKSVCPLFFVMSAIFLPIGVVLFLNSQGVVEYAYDYTECVSQEDQSRTCSRVRSNQIQMNESCTCQIFFNLTEAMTGNVFAYYGLTNFFQNHRRYVKSRDDNQLLGNHVTMSSVSSECTPYAWTIENGQFYVLAPCGAIANSLFNDSFTLSYTGTGNQNTGVPLLRTGIAWTTDHNVKFNNPLPTNDLDAAFSTYTKPLFWQTPVQFLDNTTITNNGYKNEALIVWMRTAAFPHFRKLYGRLDRSDTNFVNGLLPGQYSLTISYNYPVTSFFGRKRFILSTTSWSGGKNNFLGLAYIIFSGILFVVSLILVSIQRCARKVDVLKEDF